MFVLWQAQAKAREGRSFLEASSRKKLGYGIWREGDQQRPAGCEGDGDNTAVTVSIQEQSHSSVIHARTLLWLCWETRGDPSVAAALR